MVFMFPSSQLGMKHEPAPAVEVRIAATPAVTESVSSSGEQQVEWLIFVFPSSSEIIVKQVPAPAVEVRVAATPAVKDSASSRAEQQARG